jgi:hypothetical protein
MNNEPSERLRLLMDVEQVSAPWLERETGIDKYRWGNVKNGKAKMLVTEIQLLSKIWPEYAYWLATGLELPEAGQISPLTKRAQQTLKTRPGGA